MKKSKWITKVIVPIITCCIGVVGGEQVGEHRAINNINQEVNINLDLKNYTDVIKNLLEENTKLKSENKKIKQQNRKLKEENIDRNTDSNTKSNIDDEIDKKEKSLLEVSKALNACGGYEEKNGEAMSLRGEDYANGFIMRYYDIEEGVEFKLKKKYSTLSFDLGHVDESDKYGKFVLTIFADGEQVKMITRNPEDPVKHYNIPINKADIIKIMWEPQNGYTEFGMANIKVK